MLVRVADEDGEARRDGSVEPVDVERVDPAVVEETQELVAPEHVPRVVEDSGRTRGGGQAVGEPGQPRALGEPPLDVREDVRVRRRDDAEMGKVLVVDELHLGEQSRAPGAKERCDDDARLAADEEDDHRRPARGRSATIGCSLES